MAIPGLFGSGTTVVIPRSAQVCENAAASTVTFGTSDLLFDNTSNAWRRKRAAIDAIDADDGSRFPASANTLFNGTNFDRQRTNSQATLLASAVRNATTTTANQVNYNARGVALVLNVTANPGGGETLTLRCQYFDTIPITVIIATGTVVVAANGVYTLVVYPGAATAWTGGTAAVTAQTILPRNWNCAVAHSAGGNWTYSLTYGLIW